MSKEPFKQSLTIIAYTYMFKDAFKQALTIVAYVYMFKDIYPIPYLNTLSNYTLS